MFLVLRVFFFFFLHHASRLASDGRRNEMSLIPIVFRIRIRGKKQNIMKADLHD